MRLSARAIAEQNRYLAERQRQFRVAADALTAAFAVLPEVLRVALFGSVARPLAKEVPRFSDFAAPGSRFGTNARTSTSRSGSAASTGSTTCADCASEPCGSCMTISQIGVADHQVEVFILEPGSDQYLGRLCHFNACPKGKPECLVSGCGAHRIPPAA